MKETIDLNEYELSEKEKAILGAACVVFSEKGYSASTTSEIAKKAGIAEGTIFRYFKTKNGILDGLLLQLVNLFADKVALPSIEKILQNPQDRDIKQIVKEIILDRIKLLNHNFPLFKIIASEAFFKEDIRNILIKKIYNKLFPLFERFYGKMVLEGKVKNIRIDLAFRYFVGNILMFILQKQLFPETYESNSLDDEIDLLVDVILNGIGANTK